MSDSKLISIETICVQYDLEQSFISELHSLGLLQVAIVEQQKFVDPDEMGQLEKIIRLHRELDLNVEAIDVVFNLLEKQEALQREVNRLRTRLRLYE